MKPPALTIPGAMHGFEGTITVLYSDRPPERFPVPPSAITVDPETKTVMIRLASGTSVQAPPPRHPGDPIVFVVPAPESTPAGANKADSQDPCVEDAPLDTTSINDLPITHAMADDHPDIVHMLDDILRQVQRAKDLCAIHSPLRSS